MKNCKALVEFVQTEFRRLADPDKAEPMAKYMRTTMPFYGIQKPERVPIYRQIKKNFAPGSAEQYKENILALWNLPHREEKYSAIQYATMFRDYINFGSIPLYERLIREGAWWDLVDPLATDLVSAAQLKERNKVRPVMDRWVADDDMWVRRASVLSQNHHKKLTDQDQLFEYCLRLCHEKEFFIRKAIGWALREYSYAEPSAVKSFLKKHKNSLSPLSFKEGAKQLIRAGIMSAID